MKDKKETPVSLLRDKLVERQANGHKCKFEDFMFAFSDNIANEALEMEAKKQQKYDEMLAMLDECLNIVGDVPLGVEMTEWHKKRLYY